ncbi:GMC oxidoreductase [Marinobacter sp. EhC06]|uniref:GMC family oxidoreductase n=1 Tax=Marinobacter TaxID=2742 RepID=UPI0007D99942|nr:MULTISPECIES: choline dehydrogenase [unclassified Marinobacter]OAN88011.1 GMC oxidoreductase [Marinobacter sp. EhN04]OAN90995.1 GMC oxidoreductase [Marinobacter sp. EhC06]
MNENFDYIVVGAGSAGSVLADRLSADGRYSICILEAGPGGDSFTIRTPGAFAAHMFLKKYNWAFNARPDQKLRDGEPLFTPRGKGLGGSSSINGMLYVRGQKEDYDEWEALGNEGWGYREMLPYFLKSEHHETLSGTPYHGKGGNLHISVPETAEYPMSEAFVDAARQAGFPCNSDFNGANQEGVGYFHLNIKNGRRFGAADAYLKPAMTRQNLTVFTDAQVKKVVFEGKRSVAVELRHKGRDWVLRANREIILSGGAINSPQLLQLSGIGDRDILENLGIGCLHELPGVGKNLQEHVDACVLVSSRKNNGFTASFGGLLKMLPDTIRYTLSKQGKLAKSITEAGGFIRSSDSVNRPDVQLHMLPLLFDDSGRDLKLMSNPGYSVHVCVLRPKSSGTVNITSADPFTAPDIDYNFFADPDDCKVMVNGIRQARRILAAKAFDDYRGEEIHPGADCQSDEQIIEKVKEKVGLVYHPVGTCKMGTDRMAVVDPQLRVHGLEGLRVVDASIMPRLTSGNTNAPTIAIAEKAADMILEKAEGCDI